MAIAAPFPAARRAPSAGIRLTRRGRVVLGLGSTLILLAVVLFSGFLTAEADSSLADQGRATGVVVVQPGESLWQIAQGIAPDTDPRETVTRIRELNSLGDGPVVPGQSIVVPVVGPAGA
jgi:hypothetical protein